jgi:deoxycytidylate deaminase
MNNYLALAFKVAGKSDHRDHKLGAILVRGGSILGVAHNLDRYGRCAERRLIRPNSNYKGAILIVVRKNGRMSRPCQFCQEVIKKAGIKKVIYLDWNSNIVIEKM